MVNSNWGTKAKNGRERGKGQEHLGKVDNKYGYLREQGNTGKC